MPIYTVQCPSCNIKYDALVSVEDRHNILCNECNETVEIVLTAPKVHTFPAGYWDNLDINPVYIDSKKQLKEECDKRGLASHYLEG